MSIYEQICEKWRHHQRRQFFLNGNFVDGPELGSEKGNELVSFCNDAPKFVILSQKNMSELRREDPSCQKFIHYDLVGNKLSVMGMVICAVAGSYDENDNTLEVA